MNSLQFQGIGDVRLHNELIPTPKNGETLLRVTAVAACKLGGRVIVCRIPSNDHASFKALTACRRGLTIKVVRRMKHTYLRAIQLVATGLVDLESLITHRFSLADSAEAFKVAQAREELKVVITP